MTRLASFIMIRRRYPWVVGDGYTNLIAPLPVRNLQFDLLDVAEVSRIAWRGRALGRKV